MNKNSKWINPYIVRDTIELIRTYKTNNPMSRTPMADAAKNVPANDRQRFIRAARRIAGESVRVSRGFVFENGILVWGKSTDGSYVEVAARS